MKTTIASLGRVAAMLAFGGVFVAQGTQTDNMEGRTSPEVRPTAGTAVRLETGQGVREATTDPQDIHVWLEWYPFGGPVAYQSPDLYTGSWPNYPWPGSYSHLPIPFDWPIPTSDLVLCYGRFTVRTHHALPDLFVESIECPSMNQCCYALYCNYATGEWIFLVQADYPYRFPVFPGTLLFFDVRLSHPDLGRWSVTLPTWVL